MTLLGYSKLNEQGLAKIMALNLSKIMQLFWISFRYLGESSYL